MKTILLATGSILLAAAAPAFAQDADPAAPPPAPQASVDVANGVTFAGPRAEIFGGWDRAHARVRYTDPATGDRDTVRGHKSGGMAGALVGYDLPVGDRLIVGGFGSIAYSTAKACADTGGCIKAGREIEGGARVGARIAPNILGYVKGAYVNGQVRDTFGGGYAHANRDGWRAGAGVEYALNKHAYVKAEYDYTQFRRINLDELGGVTDPSVRLDRMQVLGGFGVRF